MKSIYLKRTLKLTALILPIILVLFILQNDIFRYEDANTKRLEHFYLEEPDSLDVVLLGASEVHHGYAPGYAYSKYGYTSYPYSMDANIGALYLPQLKEILTYQDPGLILVDVSGFSRGAHLDYQASQIRIFTESIPPSANRLETLFSFDYDNKMSFFFPFIKYHGDWDLAQLRVIYCSRYQDFLNTPSFLKGLATLSVTYSGPGQNGTANDDNRYINDENEDHLIELLEYCQQNKLYQVVFVNFPRYISNDPTNDVLAKMEQIQEIVEDYGYVFWDLQDDKLEIGLDVTQDFSSTEHLNILGQQKLTEFIGDWVINEYGLVPRTQSETNEAHWEDCATLAHEYIDIIEQELDAGNSTSIGMDTDLLPYLDSEALELVTQIHDNHDSE